MRFLFKVFAIVNVLAMSYPSMAHAIVGGKRVNSIDDHPWRVGVIVDRLVGPSYIPSNYPECGGSIIHKHWVVTAAHCVDKSFLKMVDVPLRAIQIRSNTIYTDPTVQLNNNDRQFILRQVTRIVRHPGWQYPNAQYDIALLKVDSPFEDYQIIPLNKAANFPEPGTDVTVAGWGTTALGGGRPARLREITTPVVPHEICGQYAGDGVNKFIASSMLCAGTLRENGKAVCDGDSGSGLTSSNNGEVVLVGLVSWNDACGIDGSPDVYTRISALSNWIQQILDPRPTFVKCANKGENCQLPKTGMTVFYGKYGSFSARPVIDSAITCDDSHFFNGDQELDPAYDSDKSCYFNIDLHEYSADDWMPCGVDKESSCFLPTSEPALIRYGVSADYNEFGGSESWIIKAFDESINCARGHFWYADPAHTQQKYCQYLDAPIIGRQDVGGTNFIQCADNGGVCYLPKTGMKVYYGDYGNYVTKVASTAEIDCNDETFFNGDALKDPARYIHKSCFFHVNPDVYRNDNWITCADEGGRCLWHGDQKKPRLYRYGAEGSQRWIKKASRYNQDCNNDEFFKTDPARKKKKICQYYNGDPS